jgi:DNA polymerase-3 subunit epsilon
MIDTFLIILFIALILFGIIKLFIWIWKSLFNKNRFKTTLDVSFPNPEKVNEYRFYKFVEETPDFILKYTLPQIKKHGFKLKTEFKDAIKTKIKTGEFSNPIDFKEFFGTKFDFIGIHFILGTKKLLSAFQIGVYFVQDGKLAASETYEFRPPREIFKSKSFQNSIEKTNTTLELIDCFSFNDIWESFELKEYFNSNLLVLWNNEIEILKKLFDYNQIDDYNITYISIEEIAEKNNLSILIESLLNYFDIALTVKDDLALIYCNIAAEMMKAGIDIESYKHNVSPKLKSSNVKNDFRKLNNNSKDFDFIAIDVETAKGKRWSICQIGLTVVENGEIKQSFSQLIQPPNNKYSKRNINVHKITPEITENEPTFPEIWEQIYPIIENKKLVAHSAEFDIDCLIQTLRYYDLEVPNFDYDCTFTKTGLKLKDACQAYQIPLDNHHNAEYDAEACATLYLKLMNGEEPVATVKSPPRKRETFSPANYEGHERLSGDILKPDLKNANPNSPFYNKKVVFTGILEKFDRNEAAKIVKELGGDINTSISKNTNIVITGTDPGPSKMNKIIKYNNDGCDIKIIYEKDFIALIEKI